MKEEDAMRALSNIFKALIWAVLAVYLFFQTLAVYGLLQNNAAAVQNDMPEKIFNYVPLICAAVMMLLAVILFTVFKKHRYIGIIVAVIAAGVMLVVALSLQKAFPVYVSSSGKDPGLTTAKLFINHIGIALVPILMIPAWIFERIAIKNEDMAKAMAESSGYHFSEETIFTDVDNSGRPTDKSVPPHRMKRSFRNKMNKE